jgi:hypothetical protein
VTAAVRARRVFEIRTRGFTLRSTPDAAEAFHRRQARGERTARMPKKQLPHHVKKYFDDRHEDPNDLSERMNNVFADLSQKQIDALDEIGTVLEDEDAGELGKYVFVIH